MNKLFRIIAAAGLLAGGASAFAASNVEYVNVSVPFSFVVAGQKFAPGDYRLTQDDNGIITVHGNREAVMVMSTPLTSPRAGEPTALRFASQNSSAYLVGLEIEGSGSRSIPIRRAQQRKLALSR